MSLQLVAQHLAQKGRGPDSTLVHMSNREVAGLNALAKKHGGQLSVNPDTGLPEAGFLDNILPAVAGAGLTYLSGGALSPLMSAGIVGGLTALDSKDLSKGLMAGLGAWGGGEMVGGLAGLGAAGTAEYGPTLAGASDAVRSSAVDQAIANGTYQSAVGAGASNFANAPMSSLSALGGGSALKGSLPILAGLAPAAAEAFDEEDEGDGASAQHKGYIRKYALDPVTGQYKQVGVYEAGGDPNVDVSSKAGTAGAFGGVGQSEYEATKGMADGGTATDSSRIYDYLMGRGPNPMQFTHTTAPQVNYNIPKPSEPITPTTPILEKVYDPYGNTQRGGGNDSAERREQRETDLDRVDDYLSTPENPVTMRDYWAMDKSERDALDKSAAERNPIRGFFKELGTPIFTRVLSGLESLQGPANSVGRVNSGYVAPPVVPNVEAQFFGGYPTSTPNPYSMGPGTPGFNAIPTGPTQGAFIPGTPDTQEVQNAINNTDFSGMDRGSYSAPNTPDTQAVQNAINNTDFSGMDRGGNSAPSTPSSHDVQNAINRTDFSGMDRGSSDARGGYLQHGQFDQRMAHGGIADLHQYNLGSYSDGGRLLKGPGDGVSDDIPATIGHGQPARLADGEFVIPARIVSEIGNGSTDAGARELYKMMDRVQAGRRKTVGKDQVATNTKAVRHLPA